MSTEDNDNDEVIDLEGGTPETPNNGEPEDRGDVVEPKGEPKVEDPADPKADPAEPAIDAAKPGKPAMPEMVPQSRFREVNDALKEAKASNAQLMELLARQTPAAPAAPAVPEKPAFDVKAKEREYTALLLNGEDEKAVDVRLEINAEITRLAEARADQAEERAYERMTQREQARAFTDAAVAIRSDYPELDHEGASANRKAIDFVIRERNALISEGESPHNALRAAAEAAAKVYGFAKAGASTTPDSTSNVRQIQATARNAKAANAQPAALGGVGDRATQAARVNVEAMDEDEFDALPVADKKRLRGD